MTKEEIKSLLVNATMDIMEEDDEITKIEDIGYNCYEIHIGNAVYMMGLESDLKKRYVDTTSPAEITLCDPCFLSGEFNLPLDMFSECVLEPNYDDSDFVLQICEGTGKDYKDILQDMIDIDGVVHLSQNYSDEYDELDNGMIIFRTE